MMTGIMKMNITMMNMPLKVTTITIPGMRMTTTMEVKRRGGPREEEARQ